MTPGNGRPPFSPELFDVLDACPTTKTWRTPGRPDEPRPGRAGDRALLLVGFVAALRRSELAALTLDQVAEHPNGLVLRVLMDSGCSGRAVALLFLPTGRNSGPSQMAASRVQPVRAVTGQRAGLPARGRTTSSTCSPVWLVLDLGRVDKSPVTGDCHAGIRGSREGENSLRPPDPGG